MEENKEIIEEKKKKKKGGFWGILRKIILVICVCVFLYSSYNLFTIFYGYHKIDEGNASIVSKYVADFKDDENKYLQIDWEGLQQRNPDVIAWVSIPDTHINFPVLRGEDNDEYLRSDIDHKSSIAGCVFVDSENAAPFTDLNTVIYGHHMKNDSMFSDINEYLEPTFVTTHPNVYIYLPNGTVSIYKIVSGHKVDANDMSVYNRNVQDIKDYYQKMLAGTLFNVDFDQEAGKPVVTLSTCATYSLKDTSRAVIHAVLERSDIDAKNEKMQ